MKIKELIAELEHVLASHGDLEVQLQPTPPIIDGVPAPLVSESVLFAVPDQYTEDDGVEKDFWMCSLRAWPY